MSDTAKTTAAQFAQKVRETYTRNVLPNFSAYMATRPDGEQRLIRDQLYRFYCLGQLEAYRATALEMEKKK